MEICVLVADFVSKHARMCFPWAMTAKALSKTVRLAPSVIAKRRLIIARLMPSVGENKLIGLRLGSQYGLRVKLMVKTLRPKLLTIIRQNFRGK